MPLSQHKHIAVIICIQLLISSVAQADDSLRPASIDLFTTTAFPLVDPPSSTNRSAGTRSFNLYVVDHIQRLQLALSDQLPRHPEAAKQHVLQRIGEISPPQTQDLENAGRGLAKALQYGIDRYPAIVFDGRAVVYGVTDLRVALAHYQHWRKASAP